MSLAFSVFSGEGEKERKFSEKNNPHWFVLANTDGKLAAAKTDVVCVTDVTVCDK